MTFPSGQPRLRALTIAIDDPGPLLRYLPDDKPAAAFVRRGEGFVAIGEELVFETDVALAGDVWWAETAAEIEHETELPGVFGTGPLAIGSFLFDANHSSDRSVLIVPQVIIGRRGGVSWLTCIGRSPDGEMPPLGTPPEPPLNLRFADGAMNATDWEQMVGEIIALIKRGEAEKVVLARDLIATSDTPIDPRHVANRLAASYPDTWTYSVRGLVGATPELLVRLRGGLVTSRVLAGTVRRTGGPDDAARLAADLAQSGKNAAEHDFAVRSVAEALGPYTAGMHVPDVPFVLELPNVLHLATDITGVAHEGNSALALAGALHPSAAVCGTPTPVAADLIAEFEGLDRGRYAGPVGWVDAAGDGEFALALRCGQLLSDNEIQLFAGVGIVADSVAADELAETAAKFVPMRDALSG